MVHALRSWTVIKLGVLYEVYRLLEERLPLQHAVQLVSIAIRTMNDRFVSKIDLSHAQVI